MIEKGKGHVRDNTTVLFRTVSQGWKPCTNISPFKCSKKFGSVKVHVAAKIWIEDKGHDTSTK